MPNLLGMLQAAAGNAATEETDEYFQNTVLLLHGDGNQGATNFSNTGDPIYLAFKDNSDNNFPITVNGDAYGDNFGPYALEDGYWSLYTKAQRTTWNRSAFLALSGSTAYTIEFWMYPTAVGGIYGGTIYGVNVSGRADSTWVAYTNTQLVGIQTAGAANYTLLQSVSTVPLNQWTHVAFTISGASGSATGKVYLNGVLDNTVTNMATTIADVSDAFTGTRGDGSQYDYYGYLSNFRIVNGSIVYSSNFTPPTTPLTAIANTSVLIYQSNSLVNNGLTASALIGNAASVTVFNPFDELPDGVNGSGYFDGTGDDLTVPNNAALQLADESNWTVEFWGYFVSSPSDFDVILGKGTGSGTYEYFFEGFSDNTIDILYSADGTTTWTGQHQITPAIPNGQWFHIAAVRNGATFKSYVNGVEYFSGSSFNIYAGTGVLNIGGYSGAAGQDPNMYLSNVRIVKGTAVYTSAFTPPTSPLTNVTNTSLLTCQYAGTVRNVGFIDSGPYDFPITRAGNTTQGTFSPFSKPDGRWGNYFDGTGDRFTLTSNAALTPEGGDFCVECWIYPTAAFDTYNGIFVGNATNGFFFGKITGGIGLRISGVSDVISATAPSINQWTHIAITRSGTDVRLFYDGVQQGSTVTNSTNFVQSTTYIGDNGANTANWEGYISNLRFVKGSAVYTSNFTPSTTPLTAIANTQFLSCQSNRFVDNSSNAFAITASGNVAVTPFSPFPITTAYDPSVNGGAGYFDESGDYLNTGLFSLNFSEFCLEFWLNTTSTTLNQTFINRGGSTWNISTVFNIYMSTTAGRITFLAGATVGFDTGTSSPVNDGAWHHLVFTYDGTRYRVFQDGVLRGTQTAASMGSDSQPMYFMHDPRTARYGQGYLSDFRLVTGSGNIPAAYQTASTTLGTQIFTSPTAPLTAITGTQLLCNFTNAGILDNTGFNALETVGNAQVDTTTKKYGTGSIEFDGSGDWLLLPSTPDITIGSGDFTAECWINPSVLAGAVRTFIGGGSAGALLVSIATTGSALQVNPFGSGDIINAAFSFSTGTWYHIAVTRSGTDFRAFVDGTQVGTTVTNSTNFSGPNNFIGGAGANNQLFTGYIDDLRITKGVARYLTTFTPPTKAFPDIGS